APATIIAPSAIVLTATPTHPKCSTETGSISASATGGTGAFSYSKDGVNWQNSSAFTGLAAGPYSITAKDANGWTKTASVTINQAPPPIAFSATTTQPRCGLDGGSINASATGGTGIISYSKDGTTFQSSGLFTGLQAGTYSITAKDENG